MKIRSRPLAPHLFVLLLAFAAGMAQAGAPVVRAHCDMRPGSSVLRPAARADVGLRGHADVAPAIGYAPARPPALDLVAVLLLGSSALRDETVPARDASRASLARAPPALA